MDQETEMRIRQLAYELWVAADRPEGSHLRFWNEAERLISTMNQRKSLNPATDVSGGDQTKSE